MQQAGRTVPRLFLCAEAELSGFSCVVLLGYCRGMRRIGNLHFIRTAVLRHNARCSGHVPWPRKNPPCGCEIQRASPSVARLGGATVRNSIVVSCADGIAPRRIRCTGLPDLRAQGSAASAAFNDRSWSVVRAALGMDRSFTYLGSASGRDFGRGKQLQDLGLQPHLGGAVTQSVRAM